MLTSNTPTLLCNCEISKVNIYQECDVRLVQKFILTYGMPEQRLYQNSENLQ